ncbi:MAG: hypothetical protein KKE02_21890 [Alphaproteobacteria bacterium]|nr:hypothetical protein [Alphaproteobacteria bacterium]MBU1515996.1 hypothetical protein [Alphaproteobacteria bacterium]MBU2092789.1 hypothetical protein [Alphaproteobacteria bacterium]MBU2153686.1 hypothetical protein [Alphaproteobacteria bacterium]MBU2308314.1 hypothetical protein [Alphaproteobacteria bacterium]
MSSLPPVIEQADAMLARVASLNLQAAEHVHACLLDTTQPDQLAQLSRAATQLSRSMRQTLALLARLQADRAKAAREAARHETWLKSRAEPDPDPADLFQAEHIDDVQTGVVRVIARVADGDRDRETALVHRFDRELDDWWDEPDFLDYDVDAVVRHACRVLDLPADVAARWRDLPDPDWSPDPAPRVDRPDPDRVINWPPHADIVAEDIAAEDDDPANTPRADSG